MRKAMMAAVCGGLLSVLGGCEFDTSKEHLVYCQNGGAFGCGHGTRMLMNGMANGGAVRAYQGIYPQTTQAAPANVSMNCTTTTTGPFTNTRCD